MAKDIDPIKIVSACEDCARKATALHGAAVRLQAIMARYESGDATHADMVLARAEVDRAALALRSAEATVNGETMWL